MPEEHEHSRGLYVGYLSLPRRHAAFLRVAVPLTLVFLVSVGVVIAGRSKPAGDAVWDAQAREWTGLLRLEPYPALYTRPDPDGVSAWLLCEIAKSGAHERLAGFDGRHVTLSGYRLHRDGRAIIELEPDDPATDADEAVRILDHLPAPPPAPVQRDLGRVELDGEIVDGKCYLGAMRPGNGQAHKACATLCLRGGLPPMLVTRATDGSARMLLLLIDGEAAVPEDLLPLVAEPVRVTGLLRTYGQLEVLETTPDALRRR
ncbi:MAG: hypothetical protein ACF8Q5_00260 [Phycisphaerales bacterium JB040]